MIIVGISCYYHDSSAAILKDGMLIAAAEEERFSRNKHESRFPAEAIAYCLEEAGVSIHDVDYVTFFEKPLKKFDRFYQNLLHISPDCKENYLYSWDSPYKEKLWVKEDLLKNLKIPEEKLLFIEHHISHAASAFFCSPYKEAAILTVDGVGEWATATAGKGTAYWEGDQGKNEIDLFYEITYPHSLGLLYTAFTAYLGFRENSGEYKVMGMAPYGEPRFVEDIYKNIITVDEEGGFRLNMDYIPIYKTVPWDAKKISDKFIGLFGPARIPESDFFTDQTHPKQDHPNWSAAGAKLNKHYADIAASIQVVTEEVMLKMANFLYQKTGLKNLCLAGGCALNSVANGRILRETPFEKVYIQPAASDSGSSLGAALYAYHVLLGKPRKFVMEHTYWGKSYNQNETLLAIKKFGFSYDEIHDTDKLAVLATEDLLQGKVLGLSQGRFEWGPRALGNRSIIADPRNEAMKSVVNEKIKFREPFRPFAPAILEERAGEFFDDIEDVEDNYPLRFMLTVYKTRQEKKADLQAVSHEDGTGRVQTVRKELNPLYHRIIELFGEATGVPVILNTSFNLRGEPMVTTPENALNTFSKSGLETLYLNGFVIRK